MDNRIAIGDKLDMKKIENRISVNPDRAERIYFSQVLDELDNGNMLVAMPIQEGKVIPLSVGEEFMVTFYTKSGLLSCQIVISGRYKKGTLFLLEIEQKTVLEKIQRREYFRLSCRIPVEYRIIGNEERKYVEEGNAYNTDGLEIEWKNGIMLDLSGGGMRFVSAFREEKGALVQVRFDITLMDEAEVVYAYAFLLRSEQNPNNTAIYDQRIEFFRMDQGLRERIIRFIFETQRKNRSKDMGME
ncbi:MAG: flagellar brake protein [Lachnospiraceae bacterium]